MRFPRLGITAASRSGPEVGEWSFPSLCNQERGKRSGTALNPSCPIGLGAQSCSIHVSCERLTVCRWPRPLLAANIGPSAEAILDFAPMRTIEGICSCFASVTRAASLAPYLVCSLAKQKGKRSEELGRCGNAQTCLFCDGLREMLRVVSKQPIRLAGHG